MLQATEKNTYYFIIYLFIFFLVIMQINEQKSNRKLINLLIRLKAPVIGWIIQSMWVSN